MADLYGGLQVIDVSIPVQPELIGSYNALVFPLGVYVSGNAAYVADYDNGLQIIDVNGCGVNNPPDCSGAFPSVMEIWPPDRRIVRVDILGVIDPDGDSVTVTITSITQDEPIRGYFFDMRCPDAGGLGTDRALVRAERAWRGNGRVYEVSFVASDGGGGACEGSVTVCVPRGWRWGYVCIDDGQYYDSTTCPDYNYHNNRSHKHNGNDNENANSDD